MRDQNKRVFSVSVKTEMRQTGERITKIYKIEYKCGNQVLNASDSQSHKLLPDLSAPYANCVIKSKWAQRVKKRDTSLQEAEVLKEAKSSTKVDSQAFLRASCEPLLFPRKLISHYHSNSELLESHEEQTLFELALFRSVAIEDKSNEVSKEEGELSWACGDWSSYKFDRHFPLQEEISQKGFENQIIHFIKDGIDRFYLRQPNKRPQVYALAFFLRLNSRLSRFVGEKSLIDGEYLANLFDLKDIDEQQKKDLSIDLFIEKLLSLKDISAEEKSLLSLHLILAYSTQKKRLDDNQIKKLFESWVFYKNTPLSKSWLNPLLEKEVESFVLSQSIFLNQSSSGFRHSMLDITLKQLGLGCLPPRCEITAEIPHVITAKSPDTMQVWSVNLLNGYILNDGGILQHAQHPSWLKGNLYKYLFGDQKFSCLETSGIYYFKDKKLGACRAYLPEKAKEFVLQRNIRPLRKLAFGQL